MDLPPVSVLTAEEIRRTETNGRTRPLRILCRAQDGSLTEVIVKLMDPGLSDGTPWLQCLARELIGAQLARQLGLTVPPFAFVDVTADFVDAVQDSEEYVRLKKNIGLNFGSVVIDNVLNDVPTSMRPWADVLTFDAMSFNVDRKPSNPNVLWTGSQLFSIDHGLIAPTWTFYVDGTTAHTLYGEVNVRLHAAYQYVNKKKAPFYDIGNAWKVRISRDFLESAIAQVPDAWCPSDSLISLVDFLDERGSIADLQANELSVLTS